MNIITQILIKLINEAHKLGYWDKSTILTEVVDKLLKEKYKIEAKLAMRGLGEASIIVGEK